MDLSQAYIKGDLKAIIRRNPKDLNDLLYCEPIHYGKLKEDFSYSHLATDEFRLKFLRYIFSSTVYDAPYSEIASMFLRSLIPYEEKLDKLVAAINKDRNRNRDLVIAFREYPDLIEKYTGLSDKQVSKILGSMPCLVLSEKTLLRYMPDSFEFNYFIDAIEQTYMNFFKVAKDANVPSSTILSALNVFGRKRVWSYMTVDTLREYIPSDLITDEDLEKIVPSQDCMMLAMLVAVFGKDKVVDIFNKKQEINESKYQGLFRKTLRMDKSLLDGEGLKTYVESYYSEGY